MLALNRGERRAASAADGLAARLFQPFGGFDGGADFIGKAQYQAFAAFRHDEVKREHVRENHILFDRVRREVALGVFERAAGVTEAVEAMRFIRFVPVVQKIIVEERSAYERAHVYAQTEPARQPYASHGDRERVLEHADFAVLHKAFFEIETVRAENVVRVKIDYSHCLNSGH